MLLIALTGALSGCSITRDDKASGSSTTEPSPSSSPTATVTVTESATPTASQSSTPEGPGAELLTAAEFPQLNDTLVWTEVATGDAGAEPFGLCQKFDLVSAGATGVLERTFDAGTTGPSAATAGQQVADFADAQTAVRAMRVLRSWQADCAKRVQGSRVKVGQITPVAVSQGTGWRYLVSFVRSGEGQFHSLGVAMDGTRLTVLVLDHAGQDHIYEPGQDPMELAVKAAAVKLAG